MTDAASQPTLPADLSTVADHLTPVLGRYFERSWSHGEGHRLFDTAGKAYLDFANGIAVTALGHHHPRVTAAIHAQVDRLIGPTGAIGYSEPVVRLSEMLTATLPDPIDSVMFLNSGSEAIDGALKLARRVTGRPGIVAFRGGFHGRTFGATSVTTSSLNYRTGYEPLLPGVSIAPYPAAYPEFDGDEERASEACLASLASVFETMIAPSLVASILIEPVRGEGGYNPAPVSFLQGLRRICDEHGILLIADEVQTGFGRTGRMWGFEHAGVIPDVVVMAKAIANGLPLSAIATSRSLMERWGRSAHGSTYGGNPVACAAGIAVLESIETDAPHRECRGSRRGAPGRPRPDRGRGAPDRRRPRTRPDDRRRAGQGRPGPGARRAARQGRDRAGGRPGPARPLVRLARERHPLDPADST